MALELLRGEGTEFSNRFERGTVRRRNIWRKVGGAVTESGPRLGLPFKRRACGAASADARWSVS